MIHPGRHASPPAGNLVQGSSPRSIPLLGGVGTQADLPCDSEPSRTALESFWATCPLSHGSGCQLTDVALGKWSSAIDLDELRMGPFDRIGGGHALDCLSVHVNDDVLGLHLGRFLIGWPSIARQPPGDRDLLERC